MHNVLHIEKGAQSLRLSLSLHNASALMPTSQAGPFVWCFCVGLRLSLLKRGGRGGGGRCLVEAEVVLLQTA